MADLGRPATDTPRPLWVDELVNERDDLRDALTTLIERVERDRREPDKILCAVASAKRALFDATEDHPLHRLDTDGSVTQVECRKCWDTGLRRDRYPSGVLSNFTHGPCDCGAPERP